MSGKTETIAVMNTVETTCEVLDVSRATLYALVRAGKLKKYTSTIGGIGGRRTYFRGSDIKRLSKGIVRLAGASVRSQAK